MERKQIKERQQEGIELAKIRWVYKGRAHGSKEDGLAFKFRSQCYLMLLSYYFSYFYCKIKL